MISGFYRDGREWFTVGAVGRERLTVGAVGREWLTVGAN